MRAKIEFNVDQISKALSLTKELYRKEQEAGSSMKVRQCQTMYSYLMPEKLFLMTRVVGYDGTGMYDETDLYAIDKGGNAEEMSKKLTEQGGYFEFIKSLNDLEFKDGKPVLP